MGVLKQIAAEFNYRRGRRRRDAGRLSRATEQDRYAFRAALELSRMGDPGPVLDLLMVALASLRDSGDSTPVTPGVHAFLDHVLKHLHATHSQSFQDLAAHFVSGGKRNGTVRAVQTVALSEAFDEHGLPAAIDYVSIDTEGSELDVLQGIDFKRHQIGFLTVEHNFVAPHRAAIVSLLEGHGYRTIFPSLSGQDVWMVQGDTPGVETWR